MSMNERACMDCNVNALPHLREDTPDGTICNSCLGKRMKANRDQQEILGVKNVWFGETNNGAFAFSVAGGTGAQRSSR